jgi:hypothetical protein
VRDAIPSSVVERCAERLGDVLAAADALVVWRGPRLVGWWRAVLVSVGLGGLALLVVGVVPVAGVVAAAVVLALVGCLGVDGVEPGSWRAPKRRALTGGEVWDR